MFILWFLSKLKLKMLMIGPEWCSMIDKFLWFLTVNLSFWRHFLVAVVLLVLKFWCCAWVEFDIYEVVFWYIWVLCFSALLTLMFRDLPHKLLVFRASIRNLREFKIKSVFRLFTLDFWHKNDFLHDFS